jgi:chromate transporter
MKGSSDNRNNLKEVIKFFLRLGFTAFGGPAVHIAMMREEAVEKRSWMSEQHFLDLLGATNLIPGPNSTELAIHIGKERAGWRGLLIGGLCFILPAVLITLGIACLYKSYGHLPAMQPFIYGIKPAIIAIIIAAIYPLAVKSLQTVELGIIGILSLALCFAGISQVIVLFGAGFAAMGLAAIRLRKADTFYSLLPVTFLQTSDGRFFSPSNISLFLSFLKIGAILYGSGYVLFAFLDVELVSKGVISHQQLIDAIAVGQFTPGPVFSSVTFIGYQANGLYGAIISTIGIFLPSFLFVAFLNPLVRKMRDSKLFGTFLSAVNVASIALIVFVCYQLGRDSLNNWREILIAISSALILFRFRKLNSAFIILGGSIAGYLLLLI